VWLITCTILLTLPASAFPLITGIQKFQCGINGSTSAFFRFCLFFFAGEFLKLEVLGITSKRNFIQIAICSLLYGILMELIQRYFIPNRSFDNGDIIADGVGSAAGLIYSLKRYVKK
jgi:hypothetical protein